MHDASLNDSAAGERACFAAVTAFFRALDAGDAKACAGFFAPEGVWERQGKELRGPQQVREAVLGRVPTRRTTHVVSNFLYEPVSADRARVRFLLVAYEGQIEEGGAAPVARLAGIRQCVDEFVLAGGQWRIARKSSEAWMRG